MKNLGTSAQKRIYRHHSRNICVYTGYTKKIYRLGETSSAYTITIYALITFWAQIPAFMEYYKSRKSAYTILLACPTEAGFSFCLFLIIMVVLSGFSLVY